MGNFGRARNGQHDRTPLESEPARYALGCGDHASVLRPFIAVSVYGAWETPHSTTKRDFIYADASGHRLISDLSVFASKQVFSGMSVAPPMKP